MCLFLLGSGVVQWNNILCLQSIIHAQDVELCSHGVLALPKMDILEEVPPGMSSIKSDTQPEHVVLN